MVFLYSSTGIYIAERYSSETQDEAEKYGNRLKLEFNTTTNELSLTNTDGETVVVGDTDPGEGPASSVNVLAIVQENAVLKNSMASPLDQTIHGALDVSGGLTCSWVTAVSDGRLKENLELVDDVPLEKLGTYSYTMQGKQRYGIMAQEAQEHKSLRPLIHDCGRHLSVDYNGLTALLLARVNRLEQVVGQMK